jgi:hypothetical protein
VIQEANETNVSTASAPQVKEDPDFEKVIPDIRDASRKNGATDFARQRSQFPTTTCDESEVIDLRRKLRVLDCGGDNSNRIGIESDLAMK